MPDNKIEVTKYNPAWMAGTHGWNVHPWGTERSNAGYITVWPDSLDQETGRPTGQPEIMPNMGLSRGFSLAEWQQLIEAMQMAAYIAEHGGPPEDKPLTAHELARRVVETNRAFGEWKRDHPDEYAAWAKEQEALATQIKAQLDAEPENRQPDFYLALAPLGPKPQPNQTRLQVRDDYRDWRSVQPLSRSLPERDFGVWWRHPDPAVSQATWRVTHSSGAEALLAVELTEPTRRWILLARNISIDQAREVMHGWEQINQPATLDWIVDWLTNAGLR